MTASIAVVTGAAGFIGSHVVDRLVTEGFTVRAIDNLSSGRVQNVSSHLDSGAVTLEEADITKISPDCAVFKGAEMVFHFAGLGEIVPSIENPGTYMETNVLGTVRVLEASRYSEVRRFVYAASSSCYGANPIVPTPEDATLSPEYPYALSKLQGEQAALHWANLYGLSVNSVRIFNAYGPRSRTSGAYGAVFGVFLRQKLGSMPFTVVGDGSQTRDFVYVTDVAEAFVLAGRTDLSGKIWNLGAGNPQSVNRLVELLGGDTVRLPARPGEPETTWADTSRIKHDLGWAPRVSFQQGVEEILKNIDYWQEAPLWDELSVATATQSWFRAFEGRQ